MDIMNKKTIASHSAFGGIEIKDIIYGIEDYVEFVTNAFAEFVTGVSTDNPKTHKTKIYYNASNPYFRVYGKRIYLNECLNVG